MVRLLPATNFLKLLDTNGHNGPDSGNSEEGRLELDYLTEQNKLMMQLDEEFGMKVINGCHRKSNLFGFILFSEANYNVVKAMRDHDFIAALHVISGPNWPIFFVSPLERKIDEFIGSGSRDTIGYACCVSRETKYNQSALAFFGLSNSDKDLPCFVVFSINPKTPDVVEQKAYRISGKTEDEVKYSIETIVCRIADIEKTIREGNDNNLDDPYVFWEATRSLDQMEVGNMIRKSIPGIGKISTFLSIICKLLIK